jgi:programmed cell death protein 5
MADEPSNENESRKKEISRRLREMRIEQEKKEMIRKITEPDAYDRLMNVRVANRELYAQLLDLIIALAQNNKISGRLTDMQLKGLLEQLTSRPESRIEFRHK